ncbi:uncharacterized protein LOC105639104 isoform X3 [Jatropha curcas]|uniref:uncharacterized protein LOC105639104 isoform X3 n=1 Tax=Jatropha curcas TaxID=180498 RepID=UPI0005FBAFE8|nr:uncharacterized protein LOC105639104 isoform X3 [Jatropha curcas]
MENQDHRKNDTQGHESHGVHVCHKCGWPFPNPHPSARHRRAHKKICGTIEGYKLVDSEGSAHSIVSDDEHLSDEDHKTPATIPSLSNSGDSSQLQNSEQGSYLSGSAQESQDHVSSATADFRERALTDFRTEGSVYKPSDDEGGSTYDKNPVQLEAQSDASQGNNEKTANSGDLTEADTKGNGETQTNKKNDGDYLAEIRTSENEETELDRPLLNVKDSASDNVSEASETLPKSGETDITSDPAIAAGVGQLKESPKDELDSEINLSVLSPELESVEHLNTSTGTVEINKGDALVMASASSGKSMESYEGKREGNDNFHVFSVPEDIPVAENADSIIRGYKDNKGGKLPQLVGTDLFINDRTICSLNEGTEVSASDMHGLKDILEEKSGSNEPIIENFSDDAEAGMHQIEVTINQIQMTEEFGAPKDVATEVDKSRTAQFPEEKKLPDDHCKSQTISAEHVTEALFDMNTAAGPVDAEVRQTTNLVCLGGPGDYDKGGIKRCDIAENKEDKRITEKSYIENIVVTSEPPNVLSELDRRTNSIGGDAADHDEAKVESYYLPKIDTGEDNSKLRSLEGNLSVTTKNVPESARDLLESNVAAENVSEHECVHLSGVSDNQEDRKELQSNDNINGEVQVEGIDRVTAAVESINAGENDTLQKSSNDVGDFEVLPKPSDKIDDSGVFQKSSEEDMKKEPQLSPLDASSSIQNCATVGDNLASDFVVGVSENRSKFSPDECENKFVALQLGTSAADFSDNQEDIKEFQSNDNRNGEVQVEGIDRVSSAVESINAEENDTLRKCSNNVGDFEVLLKPSDKIDDSGVFHKSSEEDMKKEPQLSPLDASSSIQNCSTVGYNLARDIVGGPSQNRSESSLDERENKFVAQQLGASAADFSVDSGSQTDSLEGHWGSVSVLSTQSDMPATVNAEPLASNGSKPTVEAEEADLKKPKALPERQHSDKSDIFEPPSFMTLVEPKGDKATDSDIQTAQNMQQPKTASLQAGWFPSLTHVVNESQGRKKNEEIIQKVTNWSTGKQHTPLKNLLGEAITETKSKSSNAKEPPLLVVQKDESGTKGNSASATTVNPILGSEMPVAEPVKKEAGKEWNSPARYPADIKREKRKVKGRPYWAQFICCSSLN